MDSHETWAPALGGGGNRRRSPLKKYKNKRFATYSSLWGAFSLCEGISATFFTYGNPFSSCGGLFRDVDLFAILFSL